MSRARLDDYRGCHCGSRVDRYGYFAGCSIPVRLNSYELSSRKVLNKLGVELVDLQGVSCCGMPIERVDHESFIFMVAKALAEAERQELNILTLCSGCFGSLSRGAAYLSEHEEEREKVNESLKEFDLTYKGTSKVRHLIQILYRDVGVRRIESEVKRKLDVLRIAAHYGCHPLKPHNIVEFDDPEEPHSLDELINATGATSIEYMDKLQCCGSPILAADENLAMKIAKSKLDNIRTAKADAVVTICPFCELMFDGMQIAISDKFKENYGIPALLLPQLLGLAMDIRPAELGLNANKVSTERILGRLP
nr:CoB--CoM heterodisulfide reductase iron-sulfur subunit B family protein [Candidatus Njordarchaeota archaeon]